MKYFSLVLLTITFTLSLSAQDSSQRFSKPPLDSSTFRKWPSVADPEISNDGNYILYTINNESPASSTLVIESTNNTWKKEIPGLQSYSAIITEDNRLVIFK